MYADDVQFLDQSEAHRVLNLRTRVEDTVNEALRWPIENRLKINPTMTDLLLIKSMRRKLNHRFTIRFGEAQIHPSAAVKALGVTVDDNLTFEAQISSCHTSVLCNYGETRKIFTSSSRRDHENDHRD